MKLIEGMTLSGFRLLSRILTFPRPVLAACTGHGIALGTFLLCCCDYRIGAKGDYIIGANEMRTNMVILFQYLNLSDSGFHKDINIEQSWGLKCILLKRLLMQD